MFRRHVLPTLPADCVPEMAIRTVSNLVRESMAKGGRGEVDDDTGLMRQSIILRDAVRRHLNRLASEHEGDRWEAVPLTDGESALAAIADWGPAEDWEDWADATR